MTETFDFLAAMSAGDTRETRRAGEIIFQMGEHGRFMYVVRSGQVQIRIGDTVFNTVGTGGIVGEMALLDDDVRSASAYALTDCEIIPIDKARLLKMVRDEPAYAVEIAGVMVSRLRRSTFLARHDELTQLPNRIAFLERCRVAIARAQRRTDSLGVLFVDLDQFKTINESLGYAVGDQLLAEVAVRLKGAIHELDGLARHSADEFLILIEDVERSHELAVKAQALLDALAAPFVVAGRNIYVSASIGISCYPEDGVEQQALINTADTAMHRAKDLGRNAYCFFSPQLSALALESLTMRNYLRQALARHEFYLNYQPRIDLVSGGITGIESLIRWRQPELGLVPPAKFIPVAEQTDMIEAIGDWVLSTACLQQKAWMDAGIAPPRIAVNLSGRQFRQADLQQRIAGILEATGLAPGSLELEITETVLMHDPARAVFALRQLREMGVAIALDDFGTEYSSLNYLQQFPLDYLKIDQSFVRDIPGDADHVAIVKAVITLAKNLGLKVIAEGVERDEQRVCLRDQGCEDMQGYLFSRPISAEDMGVLLESARAPVR